MSLKLVTAVTCPSSIEANIVRNYLEAGGVRAFLADDATIGMAWHLGTALGGVKVQVAEEDADRAAELLDADRDDPIGDAEQDSTIDAEDDEDVDEPPAAVQDEVVARALRAAFFGLMFPPLQYYAVWLLLTLPSDGERLTKRNQRRVYLVLAFIVPLQAIIGLLWWDILSIGFGVVQV